MPNRQQPSDLLLPRDVANMLRVSERTLTAWRSKGKGPKHFKIGGRVRYHRSDVEEWIRESRTRRPYWEDGSDLM